MIDIRHCTVADIFDAPNFDDVMSQYGSESAIDGMPAPQAQRDLYQAMESAGSIHIVGAFHGCRLVGFVAVIASVLPHYGAKVAVTESLFVLDGYRATGAGLSLITAAERHAELSGAVGILISTPTDGKLAQLLPLAGYANTNQVYFRSLT